MKNAVRFILVVITSIISLILLNHLAYAQDLIKPIPDENGTRVTFGQLLNNSLTPTPTADTKVLSDTRVNDFLKRLEELKEQSWEEFQSLNNKQQTINKDHEKSPTPYIPVPTLIAGVHEIIQNNPISTNLQPMINTGEMTSNPVKSTYTLAILGDSMVDTLGPDLPHLRQLLTYNFPQYFFVLLNYGFGATDMESGLYRLTNSTRYLDKDFLPLLSFKPDILVVESFAYNHWSGQSFDLDRQWLTIAKIIDKIKEVSPETKIILAATISPNSDTFGDGRLNWPKQLKWDSSLITRAYLQNLINFATSENYPLADAYHPSLGADGNGLERYINGGDHLHPSDEGKLLFAQKIMEAIKLNGMIQ